MDPGAANTPDMHFRDPQTVLSNLFLAVSMIDELIGGTTDHVWAVDETGYKLKSSAEGLKYTNVLSQNKFAARVAWVIGSLTARNMYQQDALRQVSQLK